ncbi:hypothetical protein [Agrococcus sp. SCSIO52902]|uniref:hypothetical protein n=1 Tax=Agrococcus sp. SCSIO52902 TaxID=2933290 RepID=UPI001FF5EC8F|nr:hypothetical protein [Agrococcus sp. SCSIO52902]UOV99758.1 hypothetical protein MU522_07275 [Agrococcus sp. SCSIO52902]
MNRAAFGRRATAAVALTAAMSMVGAAAASAHHCYRDQWAGAAYQHHIQGGTAWVSLSDLGAIFIIPPELQADCGWVADEVVADWMADEGLEQEPLIHSRATVGSGAAYQGKGNMPFSYLSEAQFDVLGMALMEGVEACAAELP